MTGLIGISPELAPNASRHLTELTNINIRTADKTTGDDNISGKDLLEQIIATAEKVILENAITHFSDIEAKTVIENDVAGIFKQNAATIALESGKYKGIQVRIENGNFFDLYIDSVQICSGTTATTTLKVYNLITGEELKSQSIDLTAGQYTEADISLKVKSQNQKLYLAIVTESNYATQDTDIYFSSHGCRSCGNKRYGNSYVSFYGTEVATGSTKTYSNFSSISHTNGIALRYSLQCSIESFIFKFKNLFTSAILYKAGELLMDRVVHSTDRLNSVVTIHKDKAEAKLSEYGQLYAEQMKWVLNKIQPPNDVCFSCNSRVKYKTRI